MHRVTDGGGLMNSIKARIRLVDVISDDIDLILEIYCDRQLMIHLPDATGLMQSTLDHVIS